MLFVNPYALTFSSNSDTTFLEYKIFVIILVTRHNKQNLSKQ